MSDLLPTPTYEEALRALVAGSHWPKADVLSSPRDAGWQAHAWVAKCVRVIEAGER